MFTQGSVFPMGETIGHRRHHSMQDYDDSQGRWQCHECLLLLLIFNTVLLCLCGSVGYFTLTVMFWDFQNGDVSMDGRQYVSVKEKFNQADKNSVRRFLNDWVVQHCQERSRF